MKNRIKAVLLLAFSAGVLSSCSTIRETLPDMQYFTDADKDGTFEQVMVLSQKPEPMQGLEQWDRDFYGSIQYPALARENGIVGTVILDVTVDAMGKVLTTNIKKGIFPACDEEAQRAFTAASQQGYQPLLINNEAVAYRVEVPVRFGLH